jgi:hypothetical protein
LGFNDFDGVSQIRHNSVGFCRSALAIPPVDEDGHHAGPLAGLDITPSVSDTDALRKIEIQPRSGVENHSRPRLATRAVIDIVVRADYDLIERQLPAQYVMHTVDLIASLLAPSDIWLVGYNNQRESQVPQAITCLDDAGQQAQLVDSDRRAGGSIAQLDLVEHPVTIEENCGAGACDGAGLGHAFSLPPGP